MPKPGHPYVTLTFGKTDEDYASLRDAGSSHWSSSPGKAAKRFLRERLALYRAGWDIADEDLGTLIEAVCRIERKHLPTVKEFLDTLAAEPRKPIRKRKRSDG